MAEYIASQEYLNNTIEYRQSELLKRTQEDCGLKLAEDYCYDEKHHSAVLLCDNTCIILDFDLCSVDENADKFFDYSKYCEMQNAWMLSSDRLFCFYIPAESLYGNSDSSNPTDFSRKSGRTDFSQPVCDEINHWMTLDPGNIEVSDNGGSFDKGHIDNTPLEKIFEDLFIDAYGYDALNYLKKEYSISLNQGRNAFVDYVIETAAGTFAVEETGVRYHHPQIIHLAAYSRQLEKQNKLSLLGFKTYRFF